MKKTEFFKATPLHKEYLILDMIASNDILTQRDISSSIDIAVSMVNNYLDNYEIKGYIKREYLTKKKVKYQITQSGRERMKLLNIWYLRDAQKIFSFAKDNILSFLEVLSNKGYNRILFYGAGEVAEIILQVINFSSYNKIQVLGLIDDDNRKVGTKLLNTEIISSKKIDSICFDGILISSYTHRNEIRINLISKGYEEEIIQFFL